MKKIIFVFIESLIFVILSNIISYSKNDNIEIKIGDRFPDFVLQDSGGKSYSLKELEGNYVFFIFGNRSLRKENDKWAQALKDYFNLKDDIKIFLVADMRGIPIFVSKNFVLKQIQKEKPPVTLLLDWNQKINKLLNTDPEKTNILLIDPDRNILFYQKYRLYETSEFKTLQTKIESFLSIKMKQ